MKNIFLAARRITAVFLLLAGMFLSHPAAAQWWRFGADDAEPAFSELLFNNASAMRVERSLEMSPEELDSGRVLVRGRAEVGQGSIGKVKASLDAGASWTEVPLSEKGLFAFAFTPETGRTYDFRIIALTTAGKSSNESDHSFSFRLVEEDGRALAQKAFEALLDAYMSRDRSRFMAMVSENFAGNIGALDGAISDDFRHFNSIRITPTIRSVNGADGRYSITFRFTRQVRSARTGQLLQDEATTSVTLVRDGEGFRLFDLAAPVIFGVSDPSNIASFVTDESIGESVLVVDQNGNASTESQGQETTPDGGSGSAINDGTATLVVNKGYSILSDAVIDSFLATAFAIESPGFSYEFLFGPETDAYEDLGVAAISSIASTNPTDDPMGIIQNLNDLVGRVFGLKLVDGTYALIRLSSNNGGAGPWIFEYRHQTNGTPNFN